MKFGIGQAVKRVEDKVLITGTGKFTDDIDVGEGLSAHFLRSAHAHAIVGSIDFEIAFLINFSSSFPKSFGFIEISKNLWLTPLISIEISEFPLTDLDKPKPVMLLIIYSLYFAKGLSSSDINQK